MPTAPLPPGQAEGLNPLEAAAGPLLALLTRLRSTIAHPAPASLRAQLLAYLRRYRVMNDGRSQLEALRERTSAAIRSARGEFERELSPHWRGLAVVRDRLSQFMPPWVGVAIGLALLLLLLFGLRLKLA
nr:hypothetical protein [Tanacetum cinerariifolium]